MKHMKSAQAVNATKQVCHARVVEVKVVETVPHCPFDENFETVDAAETRDAY